MPWQKITVELGFFATAAVCRSKKLEFSVFEKRASPYRTDKLNICDGVPLAVANLINLYLEKICMHIFI